jgi:hypothetical protein
MTLSKAQQIIYDRYREMNDRPFGSSIATEYKRGLDGHRTLANPSSLAFAAYLAGKGKREEIRHA